MTVLVMSAVISPFGVSTTGVVVQPDKNTAKTAMEYLMFRMGVIMPHQTKSAHALVSAQFSVIIRASVAID